MEWETCVGGWIGEIDCWLKGLGFDTEGLARAELWLGGFFAIVVFLLPLWRTAQQFIRQVRSAHYSELDKIYMDILEMSLNRTYLRDKEQIERFLEYLKNPAGSDSQQIRNSLELVRLPDHEGFRQKTAKQRLREAVADFLLGKEIAGPSLEQPPAPLSEHEDLKKKAQEYDVYAFIVFNFIETIHDRCDENRRWFRWPDRNLLNTWQGIVGEEYCLHHKWFIMEATQRKKGEKTKFCLGFTQFMLAERWKSNHWGYCSDNEILKDFPELKPENTDPKMRKTANETKWAIYRQSLQK